ncbi:hypothetical protein [Alloactinosynnema sp. L-07]|nr:hypothetical protein [Alloactinosynnema sp. L-07]
MRQGRMVAYAPTHLDSLWRSDQVNRPGRRVCLRVRTLIGATHNKTSRWGLTYPSLALR